MKNLQKLKKYLEATMSAAEEIKEFLHTLNIFIKYVTLLVKNSGDSKLFYIYNI